jgi:hypothetical protein
MHVAVYCLKFPDHKALVNADHYCITLLQLKETPWLAQEIVIFFMTVPTSIQLMSQCSYWICYAENVLLIQHAAQTLHVATSALLEH